MAGNEITIVIKARNEMAGVFKTIRSDAEKLGDDVGKVIPKRMSDSMAESSRQPSSSLVRAGDQIGRTFSERTTVRMQGMFDAMRTDPRLHRTGDAIGRTLADHTTVQMRDSFTKLEHDTQIIRSGDAIGRTLSERITQRLSSSTGGISTTIENITSNAGGRLRDSRGRFIGGAGGAGGAGGNARSSSSGGRTSVNVDDSGRERVNVDVDRESLLSRFFGLGKDAGAEMDRGIGASVSSFFSGDLISLAVKGIGVAALGAALAVPLSAAVTSAFALAMGGGVLAGGIALLAKNPAVKDAFGKLKNSLFDQDTSAVEKKVKDAQERLEKAKASGSVSGIKSATFDLKKAKAELLKVDTANYNNVSLQDLAKPLEAPLLRAIDTIKRGLNDLKPAIGELFSSMAPVLDNLAPGIVDMIKNLMPGLQDIVAASVPFFNTLAKHLPEIGSAMSDFFSSISEQGDDANLFFDDLLQVLEFLLPLLGKIIAKFTSMYSVINQLARGAKITFREISIAARTNFLLAEQSALGFVLFLVNNVFSKILIAASKALGWIPGIGPKLKKAEETFSSFRKGVNAELAKIHDKIVKIKYQISVTGQERLNAVTGHRIGGYSAHGGIKGAASGMVAGDLTWVGENGPELVNLPTGSTVRSAGDSARMARTLMGGPGGQGGGMPAGLHITVEAGAEQTLVAALLKVLRFSISTQGGNVQTVLGRA